MSKADRDRNAILLHIKAADDRIAELDAQADWLRFGRDIDALLLEADELDAETVRARADALLDAYMARRKASANVMYFLDERHKTARYRFVGGRFQPDAPL